MNLKSDWRRKILSAEAEGRVVSAIADLEKETGGELRVAIVQQSDPYPAAAWRLFAGWNVLLFPFVFEMSYVWVRQHWHFWLIAVLTSGVAWSLSKYGPRLLQKFFLHPTEVSREVKEKAIQLFYTSGLTQTKHRAGALLMVSIWEHRIEFLADQNLFKQMQENDFNSLIQHLQEKFSTRQFEQGLLECIQVLKVHMKKAIPEGNQGQELCNSILWVDRE